MGPPLQLTVFAAVLFAGSLCCLGEPETESKEPRGLRPELNELKQVVLRRSCLSVAQVVRETESGQEVGSGFFVGKGGHFVTVLSSAAATKGLWVNYGAESMRRFEAKQLATDPYTGLALLRVEGLGEAAPLDIGSSSALKPGDYLYAVAETEDPARACSAGRLAGREKWVGGRALAASVLKLNLEAPSEGFGAPVLDRDSKLVGVLLLGGEQGSKRGVSYVLPVEHVAKLLRDYRLHGRSIASWLGLGMAMGSSTPELLSVSKGGPAERAGLQAGDVILSIDGRSVTDYQDVIDSCYVLTANEPVELGLLRGLDVLEVELTPVPRRRDEKKAVD